MNIHKHNQIYLLWNKLPEFAVSNTENPDDPPLPATYSGMKTLKVSAFFLFFFF